MLKAMINDHVWNNYLTELGFIPIAETGWPPLEISICSGRYGLLPATDASGANIFIMHWPLFYSPHGVGLLFHLWIWGCIKFFLLWLVSPWMKGNYAIHIYRILNISEYATSLQLTLREFLKLL